MRSTRFIPKAQLVDRASFIVNCARGKTALHIGMGGFLDDAEMAEAYRGIDLTKSLHARLAAVASRVDGIDINVKSMEAMSKAVPGNYAYCDVCSADFASVMGGRKYQVIVFGDTIEHLDNCHSALQNLRGALADDGVLLVSTVNAYSIDSIAKMLFRYESVHEEHTAYYSYLTLRRIFAMNQLAIASFVYYTHRKFPGRFMRHPLFWLSFHCSAVFVRIFPQFAMGVMAIVRPAAVPRGSSQSMPQDVQTFVA
jgi:SAM-dependent methyltransferase